MIVVKCAGYEGHECRQKVADHRRTNKTRPVRCPSCRKVHTRNRLRKYYQDNRERAAAYQRAYRDKAIREGRIVTRKSRATRSKRLQVRDQLTDAFTSSSMLNLPTGGKFETAFNMIVSGKAEYYGMKVTIRKW